jgi:hypothetical protein
LTEKEKALLFSFSEMKKKENLLKRVSAELLDLLRAGRQESA